jgi:hypothetical protein
VDDDRRGAGVGGLGAVAKCSAKAPDKRAAFREQLVERARWVSAIFRSTGGARVIRSIQITADVYSHVSPLLTRRLRIEWPA